jgi:tetratricopeptide (TPR) repeat protein
MDKNKIIEAAAKLVAKGSYDKAIKEYEKVLAVDPNDEGILQRMGELYQKKNEPVQAAHYFAKVAESYSADGFRLKAVALYKQVLKLNPNLLEVNLKLAELHQQLGLVSEAMAYFQIVANHYDKVSDTKSSLDTLKRMVDLDPENVASKIKLAELYAREDMTREAVREFKRAAEYLKRNSRTDDYVRVIERLSALEPDNIPLAKEVAGHYVSKSEWKRALAKLQVAFKADGRDVETLNLLAQAFHGLGQTSKVISVYKELAKVYQDTGRVQEANGVWDKLVAVAPQDADVLARGPPLTRGRLQPPRVLISYSHDSEEHKQRVLELTRRLRSEGINCHLDRFVKDPPEGWPKWMERQVESADKVLVVCTETYHRRFKGDEEPGKGLGVQWEASLIRQILYEAGAVNTRFIPVIFEQADAQFVPISLRGGSKYVLPAEYEALYAHLLGQAAVAMPPLGPLRQLPPRPPVPVASPGFAAQAEPTSSQRNEALVELTHRLRVLYAQKEELIIEGQDTALVQQQILEVRRAIREGGRLQKGDLLCEDRFKLLEPIGDGGFATVWRAYDRQEQRLVAVKVLHSQYADDSLRKERFFRGARRMAGLSHPGIVRVILQEAEDHGFFFLVMEYVQEGDLRKAVREKRLKEPAAVLSVVFDTAAAVQHAHQHGLIHRDVKPANILLEMGRAKLADFDLVWAADTTGGTRTGALGTMIYAAPEASTSSAPTVSMDIYGLGMCAIFGLYGDDLPPRVMRDTHRFIQALPCAKAIQDVLVRAVEVDPVDRFATVAEFAQALKAALPKALSA